MVLAPDTDHRFGAQVGLLDGVAGVGCVIGRRGSDFVFTFDFHGNLLYYG